MKPVIRYNLAIESKNVHGKVQPSIQPSESGRYVRYSDYERLEENYQKLLDDYQKLVDSF